jgi:hypothetical protein
MLPINVSTSRSQLLTTAQHKLQYTLLSDWLHATTASCASPTAVSALPRWTSSPQLLAHPPAVRTTPVKCCAATAVVPNCGPTPAMALDCTQPLAPHCCLRRRSRPITACGATSSIPVPYETTARISLRTPTHSSTGAGIPGATDRAPGATGCRGRIAIDTSWGRARMAPPRSPKPQSCNHALQRPGARQTSSPCAQQRCCRHSEQHSAACAHRKPQHALSRSDSRSFRRSPGVCQTWLQVAT